jgi:hypothetical protein
VAEDARPADDGQNTLARLERKPAFEVLDLAERFGPACGVDNAPLGCNSRDFPEHRLHLLVQPLITRVVGRSQQATSLDQPLMGRLQQVSRQFRLAPCGCRDRDEIEI